MPVKGSSRFLRALRLSSAPALQNPSPMPLRLPFFLPSMIPGALCIKRIVLSHTQPRPDSYLLRYHNDCVITRPPPRPLPSIPHKQQNHSAPPAPRSSLITPHFAIGSHQLLEFDLIHSQQTGKLFLIAGFSACLANATPLGTQQSQLAMPAFSIASETKSQTNGTCSKQNGTIFFDRSFLPVFGARPLPRQPPIHQSPHF
jgi:hypothetical protein